MLKPYSSLWYSLWYPGQLLEHDMTNIGKTQEVFFCKRNFPLLKTHENFPKLNLCLSLVSALWTFLTFCRVLTFE